MKSFFKALGLLAILIIVLICASTFLSDHDRTPPATATPAMTASQAKARAITGVSYDALARNTEQYVGDILYYKGEVIQVIENGSIYTLRVNVTKTDWGYDDTILVNHKGARVLEDDIVRIWGRVEGRRTYETVLGANVTIPELTAIALEISS